MQLRLLSAAATAAIALAAGPARAQQDREPGEGEATSRVLVYTDDDATTVVTTAVDAEVAVPGEVVIGAHALVDVVTSASADVVSAATSRWDETRVEAGARAAVRVLDIDWGVGYVHSQEDDWASDAIRVGAGRDFFSDNTRVEVGYGVTLNRVGRAGDPAFERSLDAHMIDVGASQLVDRATRVGGSYTVQILDGFQASPYRYVITGDGARVPETHPDRRVRHAITGFAVRSLAEWLAARASYRFYADDWGVRSHTTAVRLDLAIRERWRGSVRGRVYVQDEADFYDGDYDALMSYVTADRELGRYWDAGGTAAFGVALGPVVADVSAGFVHYDFADFPPLRTRLAVLVGGGVRAAW